MRLIEEYVRALLKEDAPWIQGEERAKEAYEAAATELRAWDEAMEAYQAALKQWQDEVAAWEHADNKTRGTKPKEPTKSTWPILKRGRDKLEKVRDKAQQTYAYYNPDFGLHRPRAEPKEAAPVVEPSPGSPVFADMNRVKPLTWYAWPIDIIKASKIPYRQEGVGVGPGEKWFAYVFGGANQGTGTSFDVVLQNGTRWELKAFDSGSSTFMTGTKGLQATAALRGHLERIMKQLMSFRDMVLDFSIDSGLEGGGDRLLELVDHVISFVEDEFENIITKGEISMDRFRDLRRACIVVNDILTMRGKQKDPGEDIKPTVGLDDKEYDVTQSTFIAVAHEVERDVAQRGGRVDVLDKYDELDVALSVLTHLAFREPRQWWSDILDSVSVEEVFGGTDGLVLIHRDGFMLVPYQTIDHVVRLKSLTIGGKPKYGIEPDVFGGGPSTAATVPLTRVGQAAARSPRRGRGGGRAGGR